MYRVNLIWRTEMRLTKEQHAEIRALWATGNFKKSELATQFGVTHQSITKIINKVIEDPALPNNVEPVIEEPKPKRKLKFAFLGSRELANKENESDAEVFFQVVYTCATLGIDYRSGGAIGADYISELAYCTAMDEGYVNTIEVYVPNSYYRAEQGMGNPLQSYHKVPDVDTYEYRKSIIELIHPKPSALTSFVMALHCRSINQLCGDDLESNVDAVVCWTKGGKVTGGTATAINLAGYLDIPVFNLGADTENVLDALEKFIEDNQQ